MAPTRPRSHYSIPDVCVTADADDGGETTYAVQLDDHSRRCMVGAPAIVMPCEQRIGERTPSRPLIQLDDDPSIARLHATLRKSGIGFAHGDAQGGAPRQEGKPLPHVPRQDQVSSSSTPTLPSRCESTSSEEKQPGPESVPRISMRTSMLGKLFFGRRKKATSEESTEQASAPPTLLLSSTPHDADTEIDTT